MSPQYSPNVQLVLLTSGEGLPDAARAITCDEITGALSVIRTAHHEVHEGEMFRAWVYDLALADDAKIAIMLKTGGTQYGHLTYLTGCGGDFEFILRENPTETVVGGALAEINIHRASGNAAEIAATSNPTVTGGTGLEIDHFVGPGGTGGNAGGGALGRDEEKAIMRLNASYYAELYNRSGGAKVASLTLLWYEEGTKGG